MILYVYHEYYKNKMTDDQTAKEIAYMKSELITADNEDPKAIRYYNLQGFRMRGCKKWAGDVYKRQELGCAVIYCHHHSKGGQGQKRSMDRASGSGVFARDPDALLDLIELELNDDILKQKENEAVCTACIDVLERYSKTWEDHVSQDDMCSAVQMQKACDNYLLGKDRQEADRAVREARRSVEGLSAWRLEGTLREFPKFTPVNAWFDYPVHRIDDTGMLKDMDADGEQPYWKQNLKKSGKRNKSPCLLYTSTI